jgi:TetR/AcrR family transcriptional regulator
MCIRLFAKQGIEHTTLDEIATRAKLTKGAIYWHYSSKEALLISVLHRSRTMWSRVIPVGIDEIDDPRERLHRLFSNYLTMFREYPDLTLFYQRVRLETKSSIRKSICEFYRQSARFIEAVLRYGEEKGNISRVSKSELLLVSCHERFGRGARTVAD